MDNYLGKRLDGRYEIHQLLGIGGMAYVYKAYDNQLDCWVAIKILKDEFSRNSEFLKRFRNESKAIAILSHPNIVKVHDVSFGDRIQYIVMEYIDGITLKDYIVHNGALPWKEAVFFTSQILKALQHAHNNGIIHRDIKPQNIMLLQNGTIKVTDFGIARFSQSETQTVTDKALGSVHYIAPEQAKGEFTSEKADIYSVGVMLYEMLTGQLPFEADNAVSVAIMQLQVEPVKPRSINPQIPVGLEEITMKAMEKNPSTRFRSAGEMLNDLEQFRTNPSLTFGYSFQEEISATRQVNIYDEVKPVRHQQSNVTPVYEDDFEYEVELEKSKKHAKGSMIITGLVLAIFIVAIGLGGYGIYRYITSSSSSAVTEVMLPNFVGMNYDTEIYGQSGYSDFVFIIEESYDSSKESGIVLKQSPNSGVNVKVGKEVYLTVNRSDASERTPYIIPDFTNNDQTEIYNMIAAQGMIPEIVTESSDTYLEGKVIRTEPAAGETVYVGDTVKIIVSTGAQSVNRTVPDIIGYTLTEAQSLIVEAGLSVGSVTYQDSTEYTAETVIGCSPEVGSSVDTNTTIDIYVASTKSLTVSVPASFYLPENVNADLSLQIYVDGVLTVDTVVNPAQEGIYSTSFTGTSGYQLVVIYLDGQQYCTCYVDYDNENTNSVYYYDFYYYDGSSDNYDTDDTYIDTDDSEW